MARDSQDWNRQEFGDERHGQGSPSEPERVRVAQYEADEDWPLLSALLGGLALALLVNTFIGLIPG